MKSWFNIYKLLKTLDSRRKLEVIFLLFSSLLTAILEAFSLASFLPFLSVLVNPKSLDNSPYYEFLKFLIKEDSSKDLLFPLTIIFIFFICITALIRILNLWYAAKISASIGSDIGVKIYKKCLYQPYTKLIDTNSSTIVNAITYQAPNILGVFYSVNFLTTSLFVFISIIIGLIYIDFTLTFLISFLTILIYFLISSSIKKFLINNSKLVNNYGRKQIQSLQEGLGLIRDIILENSYNIFVEKFKFYDKRLNLKKSESKFFSTFPRFLLEAIALIFLATIALIKNEVRNQDYSFLALFGTYALGSQKLISSAQQIYSNWSNVQAKSEDVKIILSILKTNYKLENEIYDNIKPLILKNSINLKNVHFKYDNSENYTLRNINLSIRKGEKIAIIGSTGSGKSTLVDLIMGLIEPTSGKIIIDNQELNYNFKKNITNLIAWRKAISHVPQNIFLADASFQENIALGLPNHLINQNLVKKSSKIANIQNFIENSPNSYSGIVGERGLKLSGGQCQRIGIARAIYKNPKILILDEATSALDNITEKKVMKSINKSCEDITIIMISHRYSSIKNFDRVIKIENGEIIIDDIPNNVFPSLNKGI